MFSIIIMGGVIMREQFDVKAYVESMDFDELPEEIRQKLLYFILKLDERKKSLSQSPEIPSSPVPSISFHHNTYPLDS